jgi:hypothetical protein
MAVVAASSSTGSQRLLAALQGRGNMLAGVPESAPAQSNAAQLAARAAEAENERRRLAESVRTLSTDRDRLLARMASLEHALQDVTGSITQAAPAVAAPPATSNEPASSPSAGVAPATVTPPPPAPIQTSRVASQQVPEDAQDEPKPELGVDIGGAATFDGLRALWKSVSGAHGNLLEDMHPLVIVRENNRTRGADLRLIAGPVADTETAAKICAALVAARRSCQPRQFEGQKLSLVAPEPERRPVNVSPERRPSPAPTLFRPAPKRP